MNLQIDIKLVYSESDRAIINGILLDVEIICISTDKNYLHFY